MPPLLMFVIGNLFMVPADAAEPAYTERLQALEELRYANPDAAMEAANEARVQAKTTEEALAFTALIVGFHRLRAEYDQAETLATEGLARARAIGSDNLAGHFLYRLARVRWSRGDYPGSIARFHEAIPLAEASHDLALLCDIHTGITTDYALMKDWDQVDRHLAIARRCAETLDDKRRLGDYFKVLGNSYTDRKDYAAARIAHEQSRLMHAAVGNDRGVADALQNIGHTYEVDQAWDQAEHDYLAAIAIYERLNLPRHLSTVTRRLGRMLVSQGKFSAALVQLERSLTLSEQLGAPANMANAHDDLAKAYEGAGDYEKALHHKLAYWEITNRLTGEKTQRDVAVLDARFEAERSRHEADLLRADQQLQEAKLARISAQRWSLLALMLSGGVTVIAIIARQRLKLATERRIRTESEAARQAAEQAHALKTHLLGIASHDLKSPLVSILTSADLIQTHRGDDARVRGLASQIRGQGNRMFRLIRDLIDQAALESGHMQLHFESVDLATVIQHTLAANRARADVKGVILRHEASPTALSVKADPERLQQVVENLVDNAIKFSPPGTVVQLTPSRADAFARLAISDQGPGLQPEDFAHLFQPFQRLSARPTAGESGTGLGLFIAREIVALHHGKLSVDSTPEEGTTFTVELPLAESAAPRPASR